MSFPLAPPHFGMHRMGMLDTTVPQALARIVPVRIYGTLSSIRLQTRLQSSVVASAFNPATSSPCRMGQNPFIDIQ